MHVILRLLIFGDDGGWSKSIELVAEADLNLVFGQMMIDGKSPIGEGRERKIPIVGNGIFGAAPTVQPARVFEKLSWRRNPGFGGKAE